MARTKFQATPLFVENSLVLCSPFNEVIALDPGTGAARWRFDAGDLHRAAPRQPLHRIVAASPTGWTRAPPRAWSAVPGFSLAPTMRASSRSTPAPASPAPISAPAARSSSTSRKPLRWHNEFQDHLGAGGQPAA